MARFSLEPAPLLQRKLGQTNIIGDVVGQPEDSRIAMRAATIVAQLKLLEKGDGVSPTRQLTGRGHAHDAAADDDFVKRSPVGLGQWLVMISKIRLLILYYVNGRPTAYAAMQRVINQVTCTPGSWRPTGVEGGRLNVRQRTGLRTCNCRNPVATDISSVGRYYRPSPFGGNRVPQYRCTHSLGPVPFKTKESVSD